MGQIDNEALVSCITKCFNLAMDGAVPLNEQHAMFILGKRLRGSLINLLTVSFNDVTLITSLNKEIADVNAKLLAALTDITRVANTIGEVTKLVGVLDTALQFAVGLAV
jgi:hypothetical protein